jgi:hypothetical protein
MPGKVIAMLGDKEGTRGGGGVGGATPLIHFHLILSRFRH